MGFVLVSKHYLKTCQASMVRWKSWSQRSACMRTASSGWWYSALRASFTVFCSSISLKIPKRWQMDIDRYPQLCIYIIVYYFLLYIYLSLYSFIYIGFRLSLSVSEIYISLSRIYVSECGLIFIPEIAFGLLPLLILKWHILRSVSGVFSF